jgi:hypothetical protein
MPTPTPANRGEGSFFLFFASWIIIRGLGIKIPGKRLADTPIPIQKGGIPYLGTITLGWPLAALGGVAGAVVLVGL